MNIKYLSIKHNTSGSVITAILDTGDSKTITLNLSTTFDKASDVVVATNTVNESMSSLLLM